MSTNDKNHNTVITLFAYAICRLLGHEYLYNVMRNDTGMISDIEHDKTSRKNIYEYLGWFDIVNLVETIIK